VRHATRRLGFLLGRLGRITMIRRGRLCWMISGWGRMLRWVMGNRSNRLNLGNRLNLSDRRNRLSLIRLFLVVQVSSASFRSRRNSNNSFQFSLVKLNSPFLNNQLSKVKLDHKLKKSNRTHQFTALALKAFNQRSFIIILLAINVMSKLLKV
jgi:hypothetical protein